MEDRGITIKWFWIKAHAGHYGNEKADQVAKDASTQAATVDIPPSRRLGSSRPEQNEQLQKNGHVIG